MNEKNLKEVLERHKHWIKGDCAGWEGMRANLRDANLCGANLCGEDLRGANICDADLCGADLSGANLYDADLCGANLRDADLRGANLCGADLCGANLCGANLRDADLCGANLRDAKNIPYIPYACPDSSSFVGYKKAKDGIVELEILSDARRSSATGRKCRCDKAKVLGIYDYEHNLLDIQETVSNYNSDFVYKVGEIVEEPNFCEDRWNECAEGIHFFINFQEAVNY